MARCRLSFFAYFGRIYGAPICLRFYLTFTRLNFWKRDRRQPSNKDKIATFMAEAEIIIKSWNPKMAKNQVSHFLVTGKKEPPNLVSLPCSVCILFAQTNLFYFLFNLILIFKDGWIQLCKTKCLSFTWIIMLSSFIIWIIRVIATISI